MGQLANVEPECLFQVSALTYYPVKSCKGIGLDEAIIEMRGIKNDRRLMIIDNSGRFLTQREHPHMTFIEALIENGWLTMRAPDMSLLNLPCDKTGEQIDVLLWKDHCKAVDQGEQAAQWLSAYIGTPCRLVHIPDGYVRQVDQRYANSEQDQVGFADGFPLLLISQASLDDLNTRLAEPLEMTRFRPNIVVSGCAPFAEDTWKTIRIGDMMFTLAKSCARCVMTTINPQTGIQGKEPLKTLATYRHLPGRGVLFGQNIVHSNTGSIHVKDIVQVLEYQTPIIAHHYKDDALAI
jgi:uncharacterized protein